jgi:hypothetical protein
MMTGRMWCDDCGFAVENKETNNPFICGEKISKNKLSENVQYCAEIKEKYKYSLIAESNNIAVDICSNDPEEYILKLEHQVKRLLGKITYIEQLYMRS